MTSPFFQLSLSLSLSEPVVGDGCRGGGGGGGGHRLTAVSPTDAILCIDHPSSSGQNLVLTAEPSRTYSIMGSGPC